MPIKDDDPDYPALLMGNFILGGGALSSRIADRLRQKGGLSYTAMSMLQASPLDRRADLMILAIYNPINVAKVVDGRRRRAGSPAQGRRQARRAGTGQDRIPPAAAGDRAPRTRRSRRCSGGKPLRRPDHAVPGRSRAEDQDADARSRRRRAPQTPRSQAALGCHGRGFCGKKEEVGSEDLQQGPIWSAGACSRFCSLVKVAASRRTPKGAPLGRNQDLKNPRAACRHRRSGRASRPCGP